MNAITDYNLRIKTNILEELGCELHSGVMILDFGCGTGRIVHKLREVGYKAYGCDFKFKEYFSETESLSNLNIIRLINTAPYKLPFDDNTFDIVLSDQVFEHVQNYSETLAEISRVLKPDGSCLHILPSRYRPFEAHVFVPFSSIIKSYPWLVFWAKIGFRKKSQAGLSAKETGRQNYNYLKTHTNYLSKKQLTKHFKAYFNDVVYCEELFLKYSNRGRYIYLLSSIFPFLPSLYSTFRSRVIFTKQPLNNKT